MNHKPLFLAQISLPRLRTYPSGCPKPPPMQQVQDSISHLSHPSLGPQTSIGVCRASKDQLHHPVSKVRNLEGIQITSLHIQSNLTSFPLPKSVNFSPALQVPLSIKCSRPWVASELQNYFPPATLQGKDVDWVLPAPGS